jgi:hypothetical protein
MHALGSRIKTSVRFPRGSDERAAFLLEKHLRRPRQFLSLMYGMYFARPKPTKLNDAIYC